MSHHLDSYPELAGVRARWDEKTQQLKRAWGPLTEESDEAPEEVAKLFLERYSSLLGKEDGSVLDDLKMVDVTQSPAGYGVTFQQYAGEVPVYRGRVSIDVTERGQVYRMSNGYHPGAIQVDTKAILERGIDAQKACDTAVDAVGGDGHLGRAPEAQLVIYPLDEAYYLTWQVSILLKKPVQEWTVFVDVLTGRVLDKVPTLPRHVDEYGSSPDRQLFGGTKAWRS